MVSDVGFSNCGNSFKKGNCSRRPPLLASNNPTYPFYLVVIYGCSITKYGLIYMFLAIVGIFPKKETVAGDHHFLYVIVLFYLQKPLASYFQNTLKNATL